ncbi:hypothetical protein PR048_012451 [Dryococelus australis]|uniref:Uncharacterized protein n=1 Tax=Dryococelus australis TaxID=614101 RepID=A0ABQ9HPI4_9NEOP|nr:hypothetical protein PR048_012451 [Dryococelus australis]
MKWKIVRDLQALQQDIQPADVEEWLAEGNFTEITNEELGDDQIISTVLQADAEEDDIDDEDKVKGLVTPLQKKCLNSG